jgi:hypothetical protein
MARRRGAVATASARGCTIQRARQKHGVLHNLPHSSKHVDVLKLMLGIDRCWMGSCRVDFRPGLCRSSAPARRRASRAWQDGLAAWASHWAGCQGAMVGRFALVVVWARSRRGHTMRGRWHGSVVAERGLHALLGGGSHCQMVRISGRQRVRCGRRACITNACLWHNLRLVHRFKGYRGTRRINLR